MTLPIAGAVFWIAAALCLVAQVAILRAMFSAPHPEASEPGASMHVPIANRPMELVWAVLPALVLGLVLWFSWQAIHAPTVMRWDGTTPPAIAPASAPVGAIS